jgi:hypothetical protein
MGEAQEMVTKYNKIIIIIIITNKKLKVDADCVNNMKRLLTT